MSACGGGGGGGGGGDPGWYYHFICNGDYSCLSTNFAGTSQGTSSNLGPGQGGQSGCNSLMNFGRINWNIPPAQQWCDNSSGFNPPPVPGVTMTLTPSTIDATQSSTLSWSSTLVSSCTASGVSGWTGSKATSGSLVVMQANPGTYTYRLNCTGSSGSASSAATLTVNTPPPQVNLSVSPATITLGQSATLTWTSWQYTSCSASGPWSGSKALNGNAQVTPSAAGRFTYTLSCISPLKGSAGASATLIVNPTSGTAPAAPTLNLAVDREYPSCIDTGGAITLTWSTANATSCTASGAWDGEVAVNGSQTLYPGAATSSAYSTYEYVLNCAGSGGSASASRKVCVVPTNSGPPPPVTLAFTVTPTSISLGESATLSWTSQYASYCNATDAWSGIQALSGSKVVTPSSTGVFNFQLGCQNYQSAASKLVTLSVQVPSGGSPLAARFAAPQALSMNAANDLYIADSSNHTIRKIAANGTVSTVAGLAGYYASNDGLGASARFYYPLGISAESASGKIFVSDHFNYTIRQIATDGYVSTLAGAPGNLGDGVNTDGTGAAASLYRPGGVATDPNGNVYVAGYGYASIRKITPAGVVTTIAGEARTCGTADGPGANARFCGPTDIAYMPNGDLYVTDGYNTIRKIAASDGSVSTFAGTAGVQGSADGTGAAASFKNPWALAADSQGNLFVTDSGNFTLRKITPAGVVTTFVGTAGIHTGANGTGSAASFYNGPWGIAIDSNDNIYVTDACAIRKVTPAGVVTTFAGQADVCGSNNY